MRRFNILKITLFVFLYVFIITTDKITAGNPENKVSVQLKNGTLKEFIRDNHIILNRQSENPDKEKTYTISGYILDPVSHETLIGAHLFIPDANMGTVTNEFGFYSLT